MRRTGVLAVPPSLRLVVAASLVLAGCGGSGTTSASSPTSASPTTGTTASTTAAANTNIRLPATFVIRAGGRLFPSEVAAPAHTTIALTVRAGDSRRHTLEVVTRSTYKAKVAPGRPARLTLKGVADGSYVVKVDGADRGRLVVGAAPGP